MQWYWFDKEVDILGIYEDQGAAEIWLIKDEYSKLVVLDDISGECSSCHYPDTLPFEELILRNGKYLCTNHFDLYTIPNVGNTAPHEYFD